MCCVGILYRLIYQAKSLNLHDAIINHGLLDLPAIGLPLQLDLGWLVLCRFDYDKGQRGEMIKFNARTRICKLAFLQEFRLSLITGFV